MYDIIFFPFIAVMQDQVKAITAMGMAVVCITDKEVAMPTKKERILKMQDFK